MLERANVLIRHDQKIRAETLAKELGTSLSDITREALDLYFEISKEDMKMLAILADQLEESNKRADASLTHMMNVIDNYLKPKEGKKHEHESH